MRQRAAVPWCQPSHVALARRVRVLDRFLGGVVEGVKDLLVVQSVILSRQECARQALEATAAAVDGRVGWALPTYLINPLSHFGPGPIEHTDLPRN